MTWYLLGGPRHGSTGDGAAPDGYEYEGPGHEYGPTYASAVHVAGDVFRWGEDRRDIRDGHALIESVMRGEIQFDADAENLISRAMEGFQASLYAMKDFPDSDAAQNARDVLAAYRERGLL